jgi:uncharacterized repeat protein (TIGR01451 family)
MTAMMRVRRWQFACVIALSAAWACFDATDVELLQISGTGVLFGQAYVDQNGNGTIDGGDAPLKAVWVRLRSPGTQAVVDSAKTDSIGFYLLRDVPVGTYTLRLDSAAVLGDSLTTLGTGGSVTVALGDTTAVTLGASYPKLTLAEARAAAPGRRVFTNGIALNPRQFNGDGLVFFKGPTAYLRGTNVDRVNLNVGDSVRLLGRTALDNGQPTLDAVTPFVLVPQAQFPIPVDVTTAVAAAANGGALDAAFVRIQNADISDTSTVSNDFHFWAHNGGDSVEVVLRSFLSIATSPIRPDTVVRVGQASGLLSPVIDGLGNIRWRLLVRSSGEISTFNKSADIGLTTSFDTLQASVGDTVEIRVTAANAGPLTATGVQVTDTVPAALTFLSATATKGSYNQATRIWTVGDLTAGAAADTLRIRAQVTGGPGVATNTARLKPLLHEVESGSAPNTASTSPGLTIS